MKFYVGAYAASPCHSTWDPARETEYYAGLARIPEIRGLEVPYYNDLHRFDRDWFLDNLNPGWDYVLTAIPGTMQELQANPHFGLASLNEEGRRAAIGFTRGLQAAVQEMHRRLRRNAVKAVEIHSAPSMADAAVGSSGTALLESLREISQWDWQGAKLLVEHCDRYVPGQTAAKGFLPLSEEISAIKAVMNPRTPLQILINWGRSAIEERSPETPLTHIRAAQAEGVLGGLIFSGVSSQDPLYGDWADSHAPFAMEAGSCLNSLLTLAHVQETMLVAQWQTLEVFGIKMQALPKSLNVPDRIQLVRDWLACLSRIANDLGAFSSNLHHGREAATKPLRPEGPHLAP